MASRAELAMIISARNLASQTLRGVSQEVGKMGKAVRGLEGAGRAVGRLGNQFTILAGIVTGVAGLIGRDVFRMASAAVESENLFSVSMGTMEESARQFSERLRSELGLNAVAIRRELGTWNVMINSMGVGADASYEMARGLTVLTQDLASFFNLAPAEAFAKLQSGLTGQVMPLRELGIIINETSVEAFALRKGLIEQGQTMSEAQKVVARYGLILEATSKAQGDLARTMESPANQVRRLQAQFEELRIEIGEQFLPVASEALTWLNNEGLPRVRKAVEFLRDGWTEMGEEGQRRILGIAIMLLASGPLLKAVSLAIAAIGLFAKAFTALRIVSLAAIGKTALAVVGLAGIITGTLAGIGLTIEAFGISMQAMAAAARKNVPWLGEWTQGLNAMGASAIQTGKSLQQPLAQSLDFVRAMGSEAREALAEGPLPLFDQLANEVLNLGGAALKALDQWIGFEGLDIGLRKARDAAGGLADELLKGADIGKLFAQAAPQIEKVASAAKGAGVALGDVVKAMVALHPATQAAAAAVASLAARLTGLEGALKANDEATRSAQETLRGLQDTASGLSDALGKAKSRLDALKSPKLTGMTELEEQMFLIEQQIKRVQLAQRGIQIPDLGPMSAEAQAFMESLPFSVQELERMLDVMGLQKSLRYDQDLRAIQKEAEGAAEEMTFDEAIAAIRATKDEIGSLEGQLATAHAAITSQEAVLRSLEDAGRALSTQIAQLREELRLQVERQQLVNDALEIAFKWFVEDRKKILEMGGEAALQAGVVDAATRALLLAVNEFAKNETDLTLEKIRDLVDEWEKAKAKITTIAAGLPAPAGAPPSAALVPGLQHGGIVTRPTLALLGEAGPEAVVPLRRRGQEHGGPGINVRELADALARALDTRPLIIHLDGQALATRSYGLAHAPGRIGR